MRRTIIAVVATGVLMGVAPAEASANHGGGHFKPIAPPPVPPGDVRTFDKAADPPQRHHRTTESAIPEE
jgi:hypothetical protein